MRIAMDLHHIGLAGGIERFNARLAEWLCARKHSVVGFTYAEEGTTSCFPLPPQMTLARYDFSGEQHTIIPLRQQVAEFRPDVFLSTASYNNALLWCAVLQSTGIPLIYSERSNPDNIERERWNRQERQALLWGADAVHLLVPEFITSVPPTLRHKIHIIPNPLGIDPLKQSESKGNRRVLLSIGRLVPLKQIPLLIEAFSLLQHDFPEWDLHIWGAGPGEASVRENIRRYALGNRAFFFGLAKKPQEQYAAADIFCIPSRYEGFGQTVIEAMAHRLPVVGFAGCTGVNSSVRHCETGLLAPDMTASSLAATLRILMEDPAQRERIGEACLKSAESYFPDVIFPKWEALLSTTSKTARPVLSGLPHPYTPSSEEAKWQATLQRAITCGNVLLRKGQFVRRFFRNYPALKRIVKRGLGRD